MSGFSHAQMADARETFDLFDKDNNGKISTGELPTLVRSLGQNPTEAEIEEITNEADKQGEGYVSFDEFIDAAIVFSRKDPEQDLQRALKVLDPEDTGHVHADDLYESLASMGDKLTEEEVKDIQLIANDLNKDGKISIDEFVKLLSSHD